MRKILASVIIALIVCSASYAGTFRSFPAYGVCTGDYVRLRARPDTKAKILGRLFDGDEVTVVSERRRGREIWYEIEDPNDESRTVWVSGKYIEPQG